MHPDRISRRQASAYEAQSNLFKVLAHPTRLRILDILTVEESCVCHITTILHERQPYVSQHLMKLREAGLVLDWREGVIVYYRLADPSVVEGIACMRGALGEDAFPELPNSPVPGCPCPRCARNTAS